MNTLPRGNLRFYPFFGYTKFAIKTTFDVMKIFADDLKSARIPYS